MVQDSKRFRIPVRAAGSARRDKQQATDIPMPHNDETAQPPVREAPARTEQHTAAELDAGAAENREPVRDYVSEALYDADGGAVDWRHVAVRLQADAQAYRQRQALRDAQRLMEERERLLVPFLEVVDNLEHTLAVTRDDAASRGTPLYQGVFATYRGMCTLLEREGVTVIETIGLPFDPELHEAVAMMDAGNTGQQPESMVVEEVRRGYRQGERVLRPARVVVAQATS